MAMQRDCFTLVMALLALACVTAFAREEGVQLFLLGAATSVVAVLKFASMNNVRRPLRGLSGLLAFAAAMPNWSALSQFSAEAEGPVLGCFIAGLVPSLAIGGLAVWLFRGAPAP